MSAATIVIAVAGAMLIGIAAGYWLPPHGRLAARDRPRPVRRILLPFTGQEISRRAFEAAVRLAKAENAIIMPAFLARVPMSLPLESALPVQCARGMPLLEAIEQRARRFGVPVDSRIERGRTNRHALAQTIANERFDRIVVAASGGGNHGFGADDVAWLLGAAPGEIVVLKPDGEERITPASTRRRWAPRPRGDVHQTVRAGAGAPSA